MKHASPLLRLLQYLRSYRRDYLLGTLYSILNKLFDIAPEILIGVAVDTVVKQDKSLLAQAGFTNPMQQLWILGFLTFVIWAMESLTQYLYELKWRNLAQIVQHRLRVEAYDHVQHLNATTLETHRTGTLLSILNEDVNQLERFLETGVNEIIQILVSSLVIGTLFFLFAPSVALVAILPVPLILAGTFYFQHRLAGRFLEVREKAGLVAARLANNISGITTIKSFVAERFEKENLTEDSEAFRLANQEAIRISAMVTPVIRIAVLAGFLGTLLMGGVQTLQGTLAVGIFSALVFLTQRLLWPLTRLAEVLVLYQRSMASSKRVLDLLELPLEKQDDDVPLDKVHAESAIRFDNVRFAYGSNKVLDHVSLTLPAGKTAAFVGESGSGKSTLIKLLLRLYDPNEGTIYLGDKDLHQFSIKSVRHMIGFVSQDVFLVHGTIADNIAYASQQVPLEKIVEAAKQAEAHHFITQLPDGYHTMVGERGQRLSGGQRQRIAIARAILRNPPILILDEATAAVDNETERAIQKSLEKITENRTTLIVAHRLSTIVHADVIYVFKDGRIVEQGTHAELIRLSGMYAELWKLQTGQ